MKNDLTYAARSYLEQPGLRTLPGGAGRYRVFDGPDYDHANGPTHQAGVMPGREHDGLRTPFGHTGTPGAGLERNVTDLDLAANRHRAAHAADGHRGAGT